MISGTTIRIQKSSHDFTTTQWTCVLKARGNSPEAKAALGELCEAYYGPVFAFIRWHASNEDAARELTQEFFARLLAREALLMVDRHRGRFRSYLLGAVKHFLADMHDHAHRLKRNAGHSAEPLSAATDTSPGLQLADTSVPAPDREFDRKWALTVLERALAALAEEQKAAGKSIQFEALKPWLTGDTDELTQAKAAHQLGINEGAVKVAIHRLRRRFRDLVKVELAQTLQHPSQVAEEFTCLLSALGRR